MEAILSNSTRKLLWFEITKMLIAIFKNIVSFIIIFGTLLFPIVISRNSLVVLKCNEQHNSTLVYQTYNLSSW